jgi:2-polyprenylphenol 6-hydroxylase
MSVLAHNDSTSPDAEVATVMSDVVIAGAGLVGQALALSLALDNPDISIVLVDPALARCDRWLQPLTEPEGLDDFDLRVSALTDQSRRLFERIGAWQGITRLQPYTAMQVWDAEGTGAVRFDAADLHVPALGHIVENRLALAALWQQLQLCRNIEICAEPVRSIDAANPQGHTPVLLESGRTLQARVLVGADGAFSRIRAWAGLPTREWDYGHSAIVATIRCQQPLEATAWQRFLPSGPLAFLPMPVDEHLASIVWSIGHDDAAALMALDDTAFLQALSAAFEYRLGRVEAVSARALFPLRQRHARRYWTPGIVLAGDAAHTIHPLAGQGVNLGFKDVEVLAEELTRAFHRGLEPGSAAVLGRYQRRREADNLATMAAMEGFKRLFASDQPLIRLLRNEGMRCFDRLLPLKQHAMIKAMGL